MLNALPLEKMSPTGEPASPTLPPRTTPAEVPGLNARVWTPLMAPLTVMVPEEGPVEVSRATSPPSATGPVRVMKFPWVLISDPLR